MPASTNPDATIFHWKTYIRPNGSLVAVTGCFDVLHRGHIEFLSAARKHGDALLVLLENDAFIQTIKKREPYHSHEERARVLSALRDVNYVFLKESLPSEEDYTKHWMHIKPDVIAVTKGDPYFLTKKKQAEEVGGSVIEVSPLIENRSTTSILHHLK